MRVLISMAALGLAVACAPQIPDSGAGFDTTFDEALEQEAAIAGARTGASVPPPRVVSQETLAPAQPLVGTTPLAAPTAVAATQTDTAQPVVVSRADTSQTGSADDIAQETAAALAAASQNSGVAPLEASPSNPAPQALSNPAISDENDFAAVSSRESIESDAARIAKNKQSYQAVAPTALPDRPSDTGPNIVTYALSTQNNPGARVYQRTGLNLATKSQRNCAKFPSPDQAQIEFLSRGGPQRDRLALDPDGDGFACSWDPRPFRLAAQG
ncbi:MAG: hypothetical protein AB3N23_16020 [Paracoccaceae bacterium]